MGSTQSWIFDKLQLFKVKKLNNTLSKICQPFRFFDKKLCEAVYWIMIFEHCDRDGRTLGKSDKGESHFFINIRIYSLHWNVKFMIWHLVFYFDIGAPEFDIWFWSDLLIGSEIILWWLRVEVFCLTCPWIEQPIRAPMVKRWIKQWWSLCYWRGFGILSLNLLQFQIVYQILMSITNYSPHTIWVNWPSDLTIVNPQNWHFSFSS